MIVSAVFVACRNDAGPRRSVAQAWEARAADDAARRAAPPSQPPAAPPDSDDAPVAMVNGRPIPRSWLSRTLIESHGLTLLLQRTSLESVRQEAARDGLGVTPADIEAEYDLTLKLGEAGVADRAALTPQRRAQLIEQWRISRGVSIDELRLAMERQAWLRKLAIKRLVVNDQMLRDEYARLYGAKVECRHIALASLRDVDKIKPYIDAGEDFATLARRHSINDLTGGKGGLLPAFSAQDETVPGVLREAAFRMQVGQVSNPIKLNGQYHFLKIERRIEPELVKFDDVKIQVERALRERLTPIEMEKILARLNQQVILKIDDPVLRRQYIEGQKAGRIVGPVLQD